MFTSSMSVPQRVTALKNIFNDYGIQVLPNSSLEAAITAEFGPGKRSKITPLLNDLHQESDAARLAACIGTQLKQEHKDPQVLAVGNVLAHRVPALLEIIDVRHSADKRQRLLEQLLEHFITKIPENADSERLLRMLRAAQNNLQANLHTRIVGDVIENAGVICDFVQLKRFGKILQGVSPALVALDLPNYPMEQKINLCVHALRTLSIELRDTKLEKSANILDNVHWLGRMALPHLSDKATIEQGLQHLGISLGNMSTKIIMHKAMQAGLTEREVVQIVYAGAPPDVLKPNTRELMQDTRENQQYAAICGFLAKLAQEAKQPELEKVSIAGICLASLRQTFCELKTNSLHPENFSESIGTILVGVGAITDNNALAHIGNSILTGVSAYAGVMAVPGGASIAIPLAVCSVLGKLFLEPPKETGEEITLNKAFCGIMHEIIELQAQMRQEFANLHHELYVQHSKMLHALDQGFNNLAHMLQYNNAQILNGVYDLKTGLQDVQNQINHEFSDLYLEYVHAPLEEVDYLQKYGGISQANIQNSQHKLAMWLLYKSKNPKVTGLQLGLDHLSRLNHKLGESDGCLALINRYVNLNFAQTLPEDIPHIPTWLQAAHAYALLAGQFVEKSQGNETKFLEDVLGIGNKIQNFVKELATNNNLWRRIEQGHAAIAAQLCSRWNILKLQINSALVQDMTQLLQTKAPDAQIAAICAPMDEQLEAFTPISADVTKVWEQQIKHHIPSEIFAATQQGLGSLQIQFRVDKHTNTFAQLRAPNSTDSLPDHARDVLFNLIVYFQDQKTKIMHPLTTTWLSYDLHNPQQRMEQYYKPKFKHRLRHSNYNWISLDGRANQVQGHPDTATHKPIDFDNVASIYKTWLEEARPINEQQILQRVKQNPLFCSSAGELINQQECTVVHYDQISTLRSHLRNALCTIMQQKRLQYATLLRGDVILNACLQKLDVYSAVIATYMRLLNKPYHREMRVDRFNDLIQALQQSSNLNINLITQLDGLFKVQPFTFTAGEEYLQGEFYGKMQAAVARLGLLQTKAIFERYRAA